MRKARLPDDKIFLRNARGDEFEPYAALMAEADALHHAHLPALIKPPDRAKPLESEFMAILQDPNQILDVAVVDQDEHQTVAGFIHAQRLVRPEGRVHRPNTAVRIELIVVASSMRRLGIGRKLIARAHAWAREKHAEMMVLDAYAFIIVAGRLYEKTGFRVLTKRYAVSLD